MTELGFLLELLVNHKLPKPVKELLLARVKEVELSQRNIQHRPHMVIHPQAIGQAASTVAAMERQATEEPVAVIAQNATTQAAIASRAQAIANAGQLDKATGRPRKF